MERKVLESRIDQWIRENRDSMVEELLAWVSHPSVSRADLGEKGAPYGKDCRRMLDFALERGRNFGFRTADHEGYCGDILYGDSKEELGFVCHLDVVPEGGGWIYEPYRPVVKDGYVIGRGAGDNKGAAVMVLWAFRFFKEMKLPLTKTLRLMLGCAEETGMEDYRHYLNELQGQAPQLSIVADAMFPVCYAQKGGYNATLRIPAGKDIVDFRAGRVRNIVPDKAELVIRGISVTDARSALQNYTEVEVSEEKAEKAGEEKALEISGEKTEKVSKEKPAQEGVSGQAELVRITGHGKSGHAAFPEGTRNAIWVVADAVRRSGLTHLADLSGIETIAAGFSSPYGEGLDICFRDEQSGKLTLNAGVIKKAGDELKVDIDVRYPVSFRAEQVGKAITGKLASEGAGLEAVETAAPYYVDPESDTVKVLTEIYHEVTGSDGKPYAMGGGTYSRVIPNAISYGPGFPGKQRPAFLPEGHGNAHGPDEALEISDWLMGLKIYILTICRLAGEERSW